MKKNLQEKIAEMNTLLSVYADTEASRAKHGLKPDDFAVSFEMGRLNFTLDEIECEVFGGKLAALKARLEHAKGKAGL